MPDMAVSDSKFILSERYLRVDAPAESGFVGFWCEVRQNLSNGERKALIERLDDIAGNAQEQITACQSEAATIQDALKAGVPADEQRAGIARLNQLADQMDKLADTARIQRWSLVAPHIRDWNAYTSTGDEEPQKVEPPAKAGPDSLDAVTRDMADWITNELLMAYRSGKGVLNRSKPPGGSGLPTGGPKLGKSSGTKRRSPAPQTSSSGHAASAFQA